jgi:hypothetical protein
MLNARRVLARYLEATAVGDPVQLTGAFESALALYEEKAKSAQRIQEVVDRIEKMGPELEAAYRNLGKVEPNVWSETYDKWREKSGGTSLMYEADSAERGAVHGFDHLRHHCLPLFLAVLQQLSLPSNLTKKVQAAARYWSKTRVTARKDTRAWLRNFRSLNGPSLFLTHIGTWREHLALARECLEKGVSHDAVDTKIKAGPFTLVNTGNFSSDVMERVKGEVEKAAKAMTSAGFGKVCYGEVLVTNTIQSKGTVMAFYMLASDEMFVRANIKPGWDTVETICHELAHRLQNKFLSGKQRDINNLYRQIGNERVDPNTLPWPEEGQEVEFKGMKLKVLDVSRYGNKIKFGLPPGSEDAPRGITFSANIEGWSKQFSGVDVKTHRFVSNYAKKGGPDENFAEMVSFYALGKLPADQIPLLEAIIR